MFQITIRIFYKRSNSNLKQQEHKKTFVVVFPKECLTNTGARIKSWHESKVDIWHETKVDTNQKLTTYGVAFLNEAT